MIGDSSRWSYISLKAEAARSEQEDVGTPDSEALFASNEGVKQPTVLAAGAIYQIKTPYYFTVIGRFYLQQFIICSN
ncbi:hypothetical protein BWGOE4_49230 [Bacillus mycoides]|nr:MULTISPECIES: hypothetical protein [Bacillus cereus group]MBJ8071776.1 hypothetical protein [Bacillus cereus]EJV64766.1 hypothetical protein IEM_02536 [Bacillus cereus BAG6O-2]MBJ8187734.1 hypothetical protein [Bacillus cereus]OFD36699.1 hypothetical protein BWGOE2_50450 [Bacillus mycoides]OFD38771.1 hypothetical protein BWGOE3_50510 [Bacillus mycoides]